MPVFYNFTENGLVYSFDDVFVPADLFRDGNLWIWGSEGYGRLGNASLIGGITTPITTFTGGSNWKQVSCGRQHASAIKTDGTLWIWGGIISKGANSGQLGNASTSGSSTPITTFTGGTNWKQVSCGRGSNYTAAIKTDGTLWTWGYGPEGRLGNAQATNVSTPVTTFAGGTNWKQVSTGGYHTAAIKTDGTLWTWGLGTAGRLGNGATAGSIDTPITTFAGGTNWKQVSSGSSHTAAIKTDGTLWAWGRGNEGQLGDYTTLNRSTPVTTFTGGTNWKQVSCGVDHTAAIKTDGTLWTWGNGGDGQLGRFSFYTSKLTPITTFAGGNNWADTATTDAEDLYTLSAASNTSFAIKTDGTLWTWGSGTYGKLGTNGITSVSTPVTTFAGGNNWKQVSASLGNHTASIKTDGTLWAWGTANLGQLANGISTGVTVNISTPVTTFAGGTNWKQVSSGSGHVTAIKTDGTLWTWGFGASARLGNGTTSGSVSTPITTFAGGTNWKHVSCGGQHAAAIKTDGTLWTWGYGGSGVLGNASTTLRSTPVTTFAGGTNWKQVNCSSSTTAAIKTDGTLWIWGAGVAGTIGLLGNNTTVSLMSTPITTFAGGNNWKQVSSGGQHTAAIKTDGTLWIWGVGNFGRLGTNGITGVFTPVTTFAGGTNWKQVSCGSQHTVALQDDGVNKRLYLFGSNFNGELGEGFTSQDFSPAQTESKTSNWKQVFCGTTRNTQAIKTDGTLWVWGSGDSGSLGNAQATNVSTPVTTFAGGTNWKQVSTGYRFAAALTYDDPVI
jgi:alpha-tubulin suppressor-like RCC1 family protein